MDKKYEARRDVFANAEVMEKNIENGFDMTYKLFINFFNAFCNFGGINSLLDMLSSEKLIKKSGIPNLGKYGLPLDFIQYLLSPFITIKQIAKSDLITDLVAAGENAFFHRLHNLDEKEIKDLNKDNILYSLYSMKGFLRLIYNEEQVEKIIDSNEKLIFIKFLESPYLEKRLNGLTEIKRLIDSVEPSNLQRVYSRIPQLKYITSDDLVKWIIQNNILEKIINENAHAELIKRTSPILIFLAKKDKITNEIIDLLWNYQHDKHEDIIRVVYDIISGILEHLTIEVNNFFNTFIIENQLCFPKSKIHSFRIMR